MMNNQELNKIGYEKAIKLAISKLDKERIVGFVCDCSLVSANLINSCDENISEWLKNPSSSSNISDIIDTAIVNANNINSANAARSMRAAISYVDNYCDFDAVSAAAYAERILKDNIDKLVIDLLQECE